MFDKLQQGLSALIFGPPQNSWASRPPPDTRSFSRLPTPVPAHCIELIFGFDPLMRARIELGVADGVPMQPGMAIERGKFVPVVTVGVGATAKVYDLTDMVIRWQQATPVGQKLEDAITAFDTRWSKDGVRAGGDNDEGAEEGDMPDLIGARTVPAIYASDPAFHVKGGLPDTGVQIAHWSTPPLQSPFEGVTDEEIERVGLGMPRHVAAHHHFAFAG